MALWADLLDQIVDQMLANRKIFLLHERNQAAFEAMHRKDHDAKHEDLQEQVSPGAGRRPLVRPGPGPPVGLLRGGHGRRLHRRRRIRQRPVRRAERDPSRCRRDLLC